MTPETTPSIVRRIIDLGLPMPFYMPRSLEVGEGRRDDETGLRFVCARKESPHMWFAPDIDDYAVYGWLIQKFRAAYGALASTTPNTHEPAAQLWSTYAEDGHEITSGPTEIEAIVLALEAALAALKAAE